MTDQELHDAIAADGQAKALADAGNDAGCAQRLSQILPPTLVDHWVDEPGIYAAFPDPADGLAVMDGLNAAAAGNPSAVPPVPPNRVVAAALAWLQPQNNGVNLKNAAVRTMLDQLAAAGAFQQRHADTLKALAQRPTVVDYNRISAVWLRYRPDGRVASS
jgi:hypothetical protein